MRNRRNSDKTPELIQEKWSWKESKDGKSQREFAADFVSGVASAHVREEKNQDVLGKINVTLSRVGRLPDLELLSH